MAANNSAQNEALAQLAARESDNRKLLERVAELESSKATLEGELLSANELVKSRSAQFSELQRELREAHQAQLKADQDHVSAVAVKQAELSKIMLDARNAREQAQKASEELLRLQLDNGNLRLLARQRDQQLTRIQGEMKHAKMESQMSKASRPNMAAEGSDELE